MRAFLVIPVLFQLTFGQDPLQVHNISRARFGLGSGEPGLTPATRAKKLKKPVSEFTGLIFGESSPAAPPTARPLSLSWRPAQIQQELFSVPENGTGTGTGKPYRKWDCLWTSECDTPAAHLYCGKGCRAIQGTGKGQNVCFDGCCRCLISTTEVPGPLTQQYFRTRKLAP